MFKISAIYESGIAKKWKYWETWKNNRKGLVEFEGRDDNGPSVINMNDNIVVIFYVHFGLLLMCISVAVLERIFSWVCYLCLLGKKLIQKERHASDKGWHFKPKNKRRFTNVLNNMFLTGGFMFKIGKN